jgi:hypothetical protein
VGGRKLSKSVGFHEEETTSYYYANNVYGGPNGELGGGVNTWASSGCLYLLHYIAGTLG